MWRQSVNGVLRRVTGYQLARVDDSPPAADPRLEQLAGRLTRSRGQLLRARTELARTTRQLEAARARAPRRKSASRHYDEADLELFGKVGPRTMTDEVKLSGLVAATRYLIRYEIAGDFVECGVWRGGSMQAVALSLSGLGVTDRHLHLFDTFEGMPPPTEKDRRGDTTAAEMLAAEGRDHRVWAIAGLDDVREAMREVDYPAELVHFHQGMVEDTVPSRAPDRIALLRLDTDWYESTRHELEHLYDRLAPGGVLIIDDYGDWEGARRATDEFIDARGEPLLLQPLGSGRLVVKPLGRAPG